MEFIVGMLGFAVLSGPLWLIVLAVPVALWTAYWVAKRRERLVSRIVAFVTVVLAFFLVLFGDEIAGRMYLDHLCATEAGVKVYRTVELPGEYWDEQGSPKYVGANGFVDLNLLPGRFEWVGVHEPYSNAIIRIEKRRWKLFDKETGEVLGEKITFLRHYGWLNQFSPSSTTGESCRNIEGKSNDRLFQKEREKERLFFDQILKPAVSSR